jgi:hypothetical protein
LAVDKEHSGATVTIVKRSTHLTVLSQVHEKIDTVIAATVTLSSCGVNDCSKKLALHGQIINALGARVFLADPHCS